MVEFFKEATSDSYVEPGILRNKSISETTGFDMVAGSTIGEVEKSSNILNINLFFYFSSAVSTLILFLPQVRGFFSDIGWRWVHILCLSFSISF
ncbi:MAG: hypothetical protein P8185_22050, partial [Deltaproteobacteria bacterium]